MSKLAILSAVHAVGGGRKEIFEFFCRRLKHLKDKYDLDTLIAGSEGDISKSVCDKYGLGYLEYQNKPVSAKWNAGMRALRELQPDHVMFLGSDDFVNDRFVERYLELINYKPYDIIGIQDSYFMGLNFKRGRFGYCGYWAGYGKKQMMGCGRCLSRRLLDALDWTPWKDNRNGGIDSSFNRRIRTISPDIRKNLTSYKMCIKDDDNLHIDIKTVGNISSMCPLRMEEMDFDALVYKYLPEEEAKDIIAYVDKVLKERRRARTYIGSRFKSI